MRSWERDRKETTRSCKGLLSWFALVVKQWQEMNGSGEYYNGKIRHCLSLAL